MNTLFITREGVSLLGISDAAESIGMRTKGVRVSFSGLIEEVPLPCVAHWKQNHFVVVYKIKKNGKVFVADPAHGLINYSKKEFLQNWLSTKNQDENEGIVLIIEPTPDFYAFADEPINKSSFSFLFSYLRPYKKFLVQLILGMVLGSLLQLIFPFLTQSIVDFGINNRSVGFVKLIITAQFVLFASQISVNFICSWILLHISTRINVSLISDFLIKLTKLPISFFDSKMIGDILQRIGDHSRIESFLTSSTLSIIFSLVNMVIFGIVLAIYSLKIFAVFFVGSVLYGFWIFLFMKKRRELDFKMFAQMADNQSNLIQLITGMQEIKLNNCEKQKRWKWENIQAKLFHVNVKNLSLEQYQSAGAAVINQSKNIFITYIAAVSVINGSMTFGMMLAVQYIIGQLSSPIEQIINFFHATQDAKISLERLGEIHNKADEEKALSEKIKVLPEDRNLYVSKISFQYDGPHSERVLKDVNLEIPDKKITAIVGTSGSGKTTLLKLLLGFYNPVKGEIKVGDVPLSAFSKKVWRQKCGDKSVV